MNVFSKRLKELRAERQISQQSLSDRLGISKSSINMYERGEREPSFQTVSAMAELFEVDLGYLMGSSPYRNKEDWLEATRRNETNSRRVPLLGEIACGQPIFADEEYGSFAVLPHGVRADFCLKAKGDSMIGARIMDGDLVFIRKQDAVENGEIAAVIVEDTATLKRVYYYPHEGILSLNAENPRYAPLIYSGEELDHVRILGKAVGFQSVIR
ncbi:MAG: helix-turn-helix domain-containing protein [Clostridia bacterium]|nr:helix-turn-helix domain-containing protein [Clostridia bacterium]